ncbi:MAG TPA: peptidase M61 [Salinimicrobium sp.]|nr:peptidase M61 [Salinimicrobium sp.]
MKKLLICLGIASTIVACKSSSTSTTESEDQSIVATLDLVNIQNDQVKVTIDPAKITQEELKFFIPKTVPGTYSVDNYGQFIENLKAYDYNGKEIAIVKLDENSWSISEPKQLDKISYYVNDTYDISGEKGVFSPAGTNIAAGSNFMLNLHGFVGYFSEMVQNPYQLVIHRPSQMVAGTTLNLAKSTPNATASSTTDVYNASRYFEVTDNPIMYAEPDTTSFVVDGMKVLIDVYSPNDVHSAESIKPGIEKMVNAQKNFLGEIDDTDKYSILLYMADMQGVDAKGFGALEHHTSTTVVLPETMDAASLSNTMTDVVSHEFFHILTPLSVHSEEIHYFDYNNPKMSKHLWMYEGVTEYFANLFQVNQGLISNAEFYKRMGDKIETSKNFDDTVPFTHMSENILQEPYKDMYYNVYQKGALIGMALDIRLRELSNGEMGILDMMKALSSKYGQDKPFKDEELIPTIVSLTFPEIQSFFDQYVTGSTPIPYEDFFKKVGVEMGEDQVEVTYFIKGQVPYIDVNQETSEIFFRENISFNSFLEEMGIESGDVLKSINGAEYNLQNIYGLIGASQGWNIGDDISIVVLRDGEEVNLNGKVTKPMASQISVQEMELPENDPRVKLRDAWLKN